GPVGGDALPPRPSIVAHEQAGIATCENGMRLGGMSDQRLYAAIERKRGAMPCPRLPGIRTVPHSPASRTKTYTVIRRHTPPPCVSVLCHPVINKRRAGQQSVTRRHEFRRGRWRITLRSSALRTTNR